MGGTIHKYGADIEMGSRLTERERSVLTLSAAGLQGKQVAGRLGLSPRTVEIHRGRMMAKLGARTIAHAVAIAYQRGILAMRENEREAA